MITSDFIKNVREDRDFTHIQVRGPRLAKELGLTELRTRKNDYRAIAWDILGNVTVLTRKGEVRQLIGNEYKGA